MHGARTLINGVGKEWEGLAEADSDDLRPRRLGKQSLLTDARIHTGTAFKHIRLTDCRCNGGGRAAPETARSSRPMRRPRVDR